VLAEIGLDLVQAGGSERLQPVFGEIVVDAVETVLGQVARLSAGGTESFMGRTAYFSPAADPSPALHSPSASTVFEKAN
jgi:hypothetical protein